MMIAIASDHAGFALKKKLICHLEEHGAAFIDIGTTNEEPVDYPDYADALAQVIIGKKADKGILICGSGVGASIAVNKIPGIMGGLCHDTYSAHQGVEHDDMNVLVLGARVIGPALAFEITDAFLRASFSHEERHERRVGKVKGLEKKYAGKNSR